MKSVIYNIITLFLAFTVLLSLTSCANQQSNNRKYKNIVCENIFMNDIPSFKVIESEYKLNDNGDIEQYYVIQFEEDDGDEFFSEIRRIPKWKNLPVITQYFNLCSYITLLPECTIKKAYDSFNELNGTSNGMYFFEDRSSVYELKYRHLLKNDLDSSKSLSPKIDLGEGEYSQGDPVSYYKYATNFSVAIYDPDTCRLYVYVCDKAYVKNIRDTIKELN